MAGFGIGEALLIGGGLAAAQAGMSAYGASSQNQATEDAMGKAQDAAIKEQGAQGRVARVQSLRSLQNADRVQGALAVSAAERGVGFGGSAAALRRNVASQQSVDQYAIASNRYGAEQSLLARLAAEQSRLEAGSSNLFLSAAQGGLQGFSTGLMIGGGIAALSSASAAAGAGGTVFAGVPNEVPAALAAMPVYA